jgi:hypothetical protein
MLTAEGRDDVWCAVCAAVDGSCELRVGEPARHGWRKRKPAAGETWLAEHGFFHVIDAWTLPVPRTTGDWTCATLLAEALRNAFAVAGDTQFLHELTHPGAFEEELAPEDAPHSEHIASALRSLVLAGRGRAHLDGGSPATLWAWVWVTDEGRLLVEYEAPRESRDEDTWEAPLTLDGARTAADELTRRIEAERPGAASQPLLIGLIDLDGTELAR